MRTCLFAGLLLLVVGSRVDADGPAKLPTPRAAAGWTISPAASSPDFRRTSALVAPPGGVVYLGLEGEHPSGPGASILALKDGRSWTFAEGLGSVRGLEWADGMFYAVHDSVLSAIADTDGDGRGGHPRPLVTGLGPKGQAADGPDPYSAGGLRLGMDGRLYIAVGDRGLFHAVGTDRRSLQLQGGGVVRVKTDGTELEVVSTGERNPRSVLFNASGELLTFGTGDDARRWPGGLTHQVVGGHYGYPYQFLVAPFRALPVMGGGAGGAGAQAVCDLEDGLPARYRGHIFACDEARQTVARWELRKSGGTFAIAGRTELVTRGDAADFRPVALAPIGGGSGFWLVDRGDSHGGEGNVYRLESTGSDRLEPSPGPLRDDATARIQALDHPALSVRLASQRGLARQGAAAVPLLIRRLHSEESETGRLHALWALDAIDGDRARQAIRAALHDRSPRIRLQAVRSCGLRRDQEAAGSVASLLTDADPAVRREAAVALGRTGSRQAIEPLLVALGDPDRFAAWSIRSAIRRLGYPARDPMRAALVDPRRRESALILADEAWCVSVIEALIDALKATREPAVRARMVAALAGQYRKYPEWTGTWWGSDPLVSAFPRKTVNWDPSGMQAVLQGLRQGLADGDASVRFQAIVALGDAGPPAAPILRAGFAAESDHGNQEALVEALGAAPDGDSVRLLTTLVADQGRSEPLRAAALDALARFRGPDVLRARLSLVYDPNAPEALVARALPPLARDGILPLNDLAGFLERPSPLVRAAALMALNVKKALPAEIKDLVLARLDDPSPDVRQAAVLAAGALQLREAIPRLVQAAGKPDAEFRALAISALCRMPDPRAATVYRQASKDSDPSLQRAGAQALQAIGGAVDPDVARAGGTGSVLPDAASLARFAQSHPGDPRAGEELFFGATLNCGRCHVANGRGRAQQGTDLDGLGLRLDKAQLVRCLLDPSAKMAAAHRSVKSPAATSTPLQFADLITFLQELRQPPASARR